MEECLWRNFLGGFFWEKFFGGGICWEEHFGRNYLFKVIWIWKGLICLSRFCLKAEFWQTNLVCLLEFWFVCQNFGLFVSILVCLSEFWFVCQHFGLFASILVCLPAFWLTNLPTNKPNRPIWQNKKKIRSLELRAELTRK